MGAFSLYLHIPFCQAKCPYCDFNSYATPRWPEERYTAAICAELRHYAGLTPWRGGAISTVFFGGGTPSLFSPRAIGGMLEEVARLWTLAPNVETTLEANPGTVTPAKLREFRVVGVNRLSFGVQSFAPHHLQTLGRIHSGEDAVAAVRDARAAGFDNVSIDLIFALPQQTLQEWEADIAQACALEPNHVSAYNLTYEEGTPFHQWRTQGKLRQLPEEIEVAMFTRTRDMLGAAGYAPYEISNYARPGYACRHNLNYWRSGQYLGVGAGAHSYAADTHDGVGAVAEWGSRWSNEKSPSGYMHAIETHGQARCFSEVLDAQQARGEFVFLGLRCLEGFAADAFEQRFGTELVAAFAHIVELRDEGLLQCADGRWRLTDRGLLLADSVFATFV